MILFNILTSSFAQKTIKTIAEKSRNGIVAATEDILPAIADEAGASGRWKLEETLFICVETANSDGTSYTTWLYKTGWDKPSDDNVALLCAQYKEIDLFDMDIPSKQAKFNNYTESDIRLVLLNWAKLAAAGSRIDDIPIELNVTIPDERRMKLPQSNKHESNP